MGQVSEKSKSLEAAAFAVAAEVVETRNLIWAGDVAGYVVGAKPTPVWSTDDRPWRTLFGQYIRDIFVIGSRKISRCTNRLYLAGDSLAE